MAPITWKYEALIPRDIRFGSWRDVDNTEAYVLEGWGEGFMLGALFIMSCITIANMRRGVLLHKMILLELLLASGQGTFCFFSFDGYGWYLSATAALLYCSYFTHNLVAWMKIKPFFAPDNGSFSPAVCSWVRIIFLSTLTLTIPALIFQIYNNFRYFNNISKLYEHVRPYEPLMRDPWWLFSCLTLFHIIRKTFRLNVFKLIKRSPRFGILLAAIIFAIIFTIMDILASIINHLSITDGINPYWKLAEVFKCLIDNIMLDDFKSVLQRLGAVKLDGTNAMQTNSFGMSANGNLSVGGDEDETQHLEHVEYHGNGRGQHSRMSISGRMLDDGEELDSTGYTRRRQSLSSSAVGRVGIKMSNRLPGLSFIKSRAERQAQRNMHLNKRASNSSEKETATKENIPEWETMDFITAVRDSEPENVAPAQK